MSNSFKLFSNHIRGQKESYRYKKLYSYKVLNLAATDSQCFINQTQVNNKIPEIQGFYSLLITTYF